DRTGVGLAPPAPRRDLWTDAFAVFAALGLHRLDPRGPYLAKAQRLVSDVHRVLGRHRVGDARYGWISGLSEALGEEHPTTGGLRIGKPLPERAADEAMDERLEWGRDGQYFHYLVMWMHALDRVARAARDRTYIVHAVELARRACAAFVVAPERGAPPQIAWKMSVDLTRVLVASVGQHDAINGLVALERLESTRRMLAPDLAPLDGETALLRSMCGTASVWRTSDPLGAGGLLIDLTLLLGLVERGVLEADGLVARLASEAHHSVDAVKLERSIARPTSERLAFRELGLMIGLEGISRVAPRLVRAAWGPTYGRTHLELLLHVEAIVRHRAMAGSIRGDWLAPEARATPSWREHADINDAMLAAGLAPAALLDLND
ncbi:MAG: hypothetical protein ACO3IB_07360, partial [Phycisphaerales bacterium]